MDSGITAPSFDLETARLRLLYRIPAAPARGRALELTIDGVSILRGKNWAGEHLVADVSGADYVNGLPFGDGSFDIVMLHRTLDLLLGLARRGGRRFVTGEFLLQVDRVLAPGGLVIGCVENRYGLENILRRVKHKFWAHVNALGSDWVSPFSVRGCHRALTAAGFVDIRLFDMLPSADCPIQLLGIESGLSRRACKQQVEALRPLTRPSRYMVWRMLAELGISQYLGPAIFYWGRKAC